MNEAMKYINNKEEYLFVKDIKNTNDYRHSFNALTRKTYGFDFEEWYRLGFWTDKYIPYSLMHQGEVVANVSVNPIDFLIEGELHHTIQIGTVMTEKAFRHNGLCRQLLNTILKEYEDQCELIYLYANDSVLDFYPKFGFTSEMEYVYSRKIQKEKNEYSIRKLNMDNKKDRDLALQLVSNTIPVSKISMVENPGLTMFYLTSFMADNIYYIEELDLAAIVDFENDVMFLQDVFCKKEFDLDKIINAFMKEDSKKVVLGFTPWNTYLYTCEILKEEGTTFFIKGKNPIGKGRFPILSHA